MDKNTNSQLLLGKERMRIVYTRPFLLLLLKGPGYEASEWQDILAIVQKMSYVCYYYKVRLCNYNTTCVPYPRERGPMGGAPYIEPRLGGGLTFEVSVSHLYAKERPGKSPTLAS